MKEVIVTVKGTQKNEYGDIDSIELVTLGKLYKKDDAYILIYRESEISGMEGTTTTLKVEPDKITLVRMGQSEQKQVFECGVKDECVYITPYGRMLMAVIPSRVDGFLTDTGGSINLEYVLEVGREKISDNTLSVTVREV